MEKGSLDSISIDVSAPAFRSSFSRYSSLLTQAVPAPVPMDVDGEDDGTQRAAEITDYGVEVDFEALDEEEKEVRRLFARVTQVY